MRLLTVLSTILLLSGLVAAQAMGGRGFAGYCPYGCGPYIPLVTTPMVSLQTVSPSPVGARNATGGLVAGATDSTLSNVPMSPNAVYTRPVWYSGATTPIISPAVNLPVALNAPARAVRRERIERYPEQHAWVFFSAPEETSNAAEAAASAKSGKRAVRTYTNQDVERMNQQNGLVKYDNKTEHID